MAIDENSATDENDTTPKVLRPRQVCLDEAGELAAYNILNNRTSISVQEFVRPFVRKAIKEMAQNVVAKTKY